MMISSYQFITCYHFITAMMRGVSFRLRRKALLDSLGRTAASSIEKFTEVVQRHLLTMGFVVTNLSKVDTSEKMYRLDIYNVYNVYTHTHIYIYNIYICKCTKRSGH